MQRSKLLCTQYCNLWCAIPSGSYNNIIINCENDRMNGKNFSYFLERGVERAEVGCQD